MRRIKSGLLAASLLLAFGGQWVRGGTDYNINSGDVFAQVSVGGSPTGQSSDASSGAANVTAAAGNATATTTLTSTATSISISKSDTRDGTAGDYSQSQLGLYFTPTQNLEYSISGSYSFDSSSYVNPDSQATYNVFLTQSGNPLYSGEITNSHTTPLSLTSNVPLTGSLTGLLQAGVEYEYSVTSNIAAPSGNDSGDIATGNDSISFTPVPEPGSLSVLGMGAFALVRRRSRSCAFANRSVEPLFLPLGKDRI